MTATKIYDLNRRSLMQEALQISATRFGYCGVLTLGAHYLVGTPPYGLGVSILLLPLKVHLLWIVIQFLFHLHYIHRGRKKADRLRTVSP